ncbi:MULTISPECIES: hypothetical protein [unclassified Nocardioides]|uniref:hypothetical protein n=1 Tax=unclassified Nocardioides TaxID=2615069 RepID=UPI000A43B098|nr:MULTISPECIES: hypothetical protein [unclassified Nocardioides]
MSNHAPNQATNPAGSARPIPVVGPPSKHQLALMIWIAVFPTLTVLNLTIGPSLKDTNPVLRTFVLATIAVPIVIYGLMPRLHKARGRLLARRAGA